TQQQLADRFGPTQQAYDAVLGYIQSKGLTLVEGSDNRLTLLVAGTRRQVERAFDAKIGQYELNGRQFFANSENPLLPLSVAPYVQSVVGLTDLARPGEISDPGQTEILRKKKDCIRNPKFSNIKRVLCSLQSFPLFIFYLIGCVLIEAFFILINPLSI